MSSRTMFRRNAGPLGVGAAAALAIATALTFTASAETLPTNAPSAAPTSAPSRTAQTGERNGARPRGGAFHHLVLEPTLVQSENVGSDTVLCFHATSHVGCKNPTTAVLPGDLLRVAGNARWNFNRHLGLRYQRIAHLGIGGRTGGSGANAKYGNSGYDYEELESVEWSFNPYLTFNTGWDYRATVCCPGAGDPNNPTPREKQGPFLAASWRFGPNTRIGKPLTLALRTTFVNHRFDAGAQAGLSRGQTDAGRKNEYVPTIYYNIPAYGQTRVNPFAGIEYYGTYFDNRPSISLTYRKVIGLAFRASPVLSFRAIVKNDQNYATGPDATHKSYLQLEATYRYER